MRNKISVVGAGHVGATTAQYVAEMELADVVLVDIVERASSGEGAGSHGSESRERVRGFRDGRQRL